MDSGVCSAIHYVWDEFHTVLSIFISFSICKVQFRIALFLFVFPIGFCFYLFLSIFYFSTVQSLSHGWLFATPWATAHQASLSISNSQSPPKPMSIELVMPSNYLILCHPLLLLPLIFPSIRVFSNESALRIRWPKYWSFSFNVSPSNERPGLISFRMDWLGLLVVQGTLRVFSNTTTMQFSHNYTYIPSLANFPPLPTTHLSRSSQSSRLGSLCYTATSHQYPTYTW